MSAKSKKSAYVEPVPDLLRRLAQNDYMVNQFFTEDGKLLNTAAETVEIMLAVLRNLLGKCAVVGLTNDEGDDASMADAINDMGVAEEAARVAVARATGG